MNQDRDAKLVDVTHLKYTLNMEKYVRLIYENKSRVELPKSNIVFQG